MALQSLDGAGAWMPVIDGVAVLASSTYVMDASGEICALIIRVPKTGTIDRFEALIGAVTNAPDNGLRFSFQDVDLATGLPDGVVDQFATIASGSVAIGWANPGNFNATRAVTRGDYLALVVDLPTFVAADSVSISSLTSSIGHGFPYAVSATSTKSSTVFPCVALHYDDGTYGYLGPDVYPVAAVTSPAFNSGTALADEYALAVQFPGPVKLNAVRLPTAVAAGADFDIVVYDADGTSVLATLNHDGSLTTATTIVMYTLPLQTQVSFLANTTYRIALKPSTTNNVTPKYLTFASAALMDAMEGGNVCYLSTRVDAGAWTNYNNVTDGFRRLLMSLQVSAVDDAAGGGGGGSETFTGSVINRGLN